MEINKLDYVQWYQHPVTEALRLALLEQLDDVQMYLMKKAGKDQLEDRRLVGVIEGVQWLLDWEPTYIEQGEETDGTSSSGA